MVDGDEEAVEEEWVVVVVAARNCPTPRGLVMQMGSDISHHLAIWN